MNQSISVSRFLSSPLFFPVPLKRLEGRCRLRLGFTEQTVLPKTLPLSLHSLTWPKPLQFYPASWIFDKIFCHIFLIGQNGPLTKLNDPGNNFFSKEEQSKVLKKEVSHWDEFLWVGLAYTWIYFSYAYANSKSDTLCAPQGFPPKW